MDIIKIDCLEYLEKIVDETNGYIKDNHYSENGHNNLANYFSKLIN